MNYINAITSGAERIQLDRKKEHYRRKILNIIIFIYLLLILEGAIRKWILPEFAQYIFFIRVPVTFYLYLYVWRLGAWPLPNKLFVCSLFLSIIGLVLIPIQMAIGQYSFKYLLLAAYGWINYFFFIPLAFIIADHLKISDLTRIAKITFILAIVAAPLTMLQLYAPADSVLIRGFGVGALNEFSGLGFGNALIRPMGYFTSSSGQQMFTSSVVAFVVASWILPTMLANISLFMRGAAIIAIVVLIGVSMQRGALVHAGVVVIFTLLAGLLTSRSRYLNKSLVVPSVIIVLGLSIMIIWFPVATEMFSIRLLGAFQQGSSEYEVYGSFGFFGRIFRELTKFITIIQYVPGFGYILGIAGNAAPQLSWVEFPTIWYTWSGMEGFSEDGLSKNIVELGPVFGLLFIFYRFSIFFFLFQKSIYCARNKNMLPMILLGFTGPLLLTLQMTANGTMIGYAWIFIGFIMASIRETQQLKLKELIAKKPQFRK